MEQAKMKVAYGVTARGEKNYWHRIGVAFTNRDGSLSVRLDALPMSGNIQIRDYEPREDFDNRRGRKFVAPTLDEAEQSL